MSRIRLLLISPGLFDKGGISRYTRFQLLALRRLLGEDQVAAASLLGMQPGDFEEPLRVDLAGAVPLSSASRAYFAGAVMNLVRRLRPRLVLTGHVNLGPLGLVAARLTGARCVQTIYGLEVWSGLSPARRFALRAADRVISDSENTADRVLQLGLLDRKPRVVWDCVDLDRYTPGAPDPTALARYGLDAEPGRFRLLFLSRLNRDARYKGVERFLHLLSRLPEERFIGVVAGRGDQAPAFQALARELGLGERVRFTGSVHEADMPAIYRAADAFYLASEAGPGMGEGVPLTPLEAMACGAPVLVGNQDGSREILDGRGGHCGDPLDLQAQAAYLLSLDADPALHADERRAARRRAEEAFGFEAFMNRTRSTLEDLL